MGARSLVVAQSLAALATVSDVYAPSRSTDRDRRSWQVSWLGSLILVRWDGGDPHAWHDVRWTAGVSAILGGWPPWSISDAEVDRFRRRIEELSSGAVEDPAPCSTGDAIEFTYLSFYKIKARCLWVGSGVVGVRIRMLGHDHALQVPWSFVERVEDRIEARQYGRRVSALHTGSKNNVAID